MGNWKMWKRGGFLSSSLGLSCLFVFVLCLLLLLNSMLPDVSLDDQDKGSFRKWIPGKTAEEVGLGKLGDTMVSMLPNDLAFTVFVPSEEAFERVLKLQSSDSLVEDKVNDTFATLSRVMGFSAVPLHLPSRTVPVLKEVSLDSVSGYRLYAWRASNGTLVVNNVRSKQVDVRRAETIVHVMNGVVMDAEFEQSFRPDDED